jgi:NAD(P)-dependent dehydrogenase (short-subunit alcohol dehydrogenase family)
MEGILTMARIFITGSADGLGQLAAKELVARGHKVVLHARNEKRGQEALQHIPGAEAVLTGDLTSREETIKLAHQANDTGIFDAVIHNAGLYQAHAKDVFAVNTLAPYILTSLMKKPGRLVYLSSGMHLQGSAKLESFTQDINAINYSDTKLHVLLLCKAVARKWNVFANAVNPGWVPTKMGGKGAPDDLHLGYATQVWLAESKEATITGKYFFHQEEERPNPEADDIMLQDKFLQLCAQVTGVHFPG